MAYNRVIDARLTDNGTPTEPVTVSEAKAFALIVSAAQDSIVESLIVSARKMIEKATGLSLVAKTVEAWILAPEGDFELPFGPVKASPAPVFEDASGNTITVDLVGFDYPVIEGHYDDRIKAEYSVGFTTVPDDLKLAIKFQVVDWFENRGDDPQQWSANMQLALCSRVSSICQKYSRIPVLY